MHTIELINKARTEIVQHTVGSISWRFLPQDTVHVILRLNWFDRAIHARVLQAPVLTAGYVCSFSKRKTHCKANGDLQFQSLFAAAARNRNFGIGISTDYRSPNVASRSMSKQRRSERTSPSLQVPPPVATPTNPRSATISGEAFRSRAFSARTSSSSCNALDRSSLPEQ